MKNTVLTILLLSLSYLNNFAKDNSAIIIECIVKDKALKAYLPYVNIYNETTAEGTITNINGLFRLKVSSKDDIIRLSMIGYETIKKRTGELLPQKVLYLEAKSEALNEVRVYADNSILYRVVNKCRQKGKYEFKRKIWHNKKGKCYFELKTEVGEKQSEHIECYYNGDLSTYHINGLQFKNGRAKLDTVETKYYLNTGTSHVFYMYELFNESSRFPISPLPITHSRLKKIYNLALEQTYKTKMGIPALLSRLNQNEAIAIISQGNYGSMSNLIIWRRVI